MTVLTLAGVSLVVCLTCAGDKLASVGLAALPRTSPQHEIHFCCFVALLFPDGCFVDSGGSFVAPTRTTQDGRARQLGETKPFACVREGSVAANHPANQSLPLHSTPNFLLWLARGGQRAHKIEPHCRGEMRGCATTQNCGCSHTSSKLFG